MTGRAAVFLDRDGTLIEDPGYLRDPNAVRLLPGAAAAVARLNAAGWTTVVVTNQSGIARGLLTEADYHAVQARIKSLLATEDAHLDGEYFCPHLPELTGPCACRKPGTLLYEQAARHHGLDLAASWWVGDRLRDVLPADAFGGQGILIGPGDDAREAPRFTPVPDLAAAVHQILTRLPRSGYVQAP